MNLRSEEESSDRERRSNSHQLGHMFKYCLMCVSDVCVCVCKRV